MSCRAQQLLPFAFESHKVRVVFDEKGDPWFVAADVCAALSIGNPSEAVRRLDDDEKGLSSAETPSGHQQIVTVNEPGLFALALGSRTAEAKRFKRWVTYEVLPAIHKTGTYSAHTPQTFAQALRLAAAQAERLEAQQRQLAAQQPAVEFVARYVEAKSTKCLRDVAKVLGIKQNTFVALLLEDGVLFRQSGQLRPVAEYQARGYFEVKTGEANGHAYVHMRFTPEGIAWAAKRYGKTEALGDLGAS